MRLVICGFFSSSLIRVSGTPLRPKPPARRVLFERRSWMAEAADGNTAGVVSGGGGVYGEEGRGGGAFIDLISVRGARKAAEGVL